MPRETRSRGIPPPSRVYHSTPTLQQAQFPPRRTKVRRPEESEQAPTPSLKQQTLTQFDFVSSFEEDRDDVVGLSDSDDDIKAPRTHDNKENRRPGELELQVSETEGDSDAASDVQGIANDDDEPVARRRKRAYVKSEPARKRRRRTLGDNNESKRIKSEKGTSRRKTFGDAPASSNYHTQTLTQFLGHQTSFIADSDDEDNGPGGLDLGESEDDGFLSWLGQPGSPSAGRGRQNHSSPAVKQRHDAAAAAAAKSRRNGNTMSREDSVIPQTPAKRNTTIRFEIPSGGIHSTPPLSLIDRYGPPDDQESPLKNRSSPLGAAPAELKGNVDTNQTTPSKSTRPSLVIQDSYATESWESPSKSQFRSPGGSVGLASMTATPTKHLATVEESPSASAARMSTSATQQKGRRTKKIPSPEKSAAMAGGRDEIPDSDEDDYEGFEEHSDEGPEPDDGNEQETFVAGADTQLALSEVASSGQTQRPSASTQKSSSARSHEDDGQEPESTSSAVRNASPSITQSAPMPCSSQHQTSPTTPKSQQVHTVAKHPPPIRVPLHHHLSAQTQTQSQPYESQRVPTSILHSLPTPSARSDIILPMSLPALEGLVTGRTVHVSTNFKIPAQVVRFWLLEGSLLRYMACVEPPGQSRGGQWQYYVSQVYELNNPVQEEDMRAEWWISGQIERYSYLPPAVISQLLWNLRHAVFIDGSLEEQQQQGRNQHEAITPSTSTQHIQGVSVHEQPAPELPPAADNTTPPGSMSVSQQITAQIRSDIATSTQFPTSDDLLVPSTPDDNQHLRTYMQISTPNETTAIPIMPPPPDYPPPPPSSTGRTPSASKINSGIIQTQNAIRPSQATTISQTSTPEKHSNAPGPGSISSTRYQTSAAVAPMPPPPQFDHNSNSLYDGSVAFLDQSHSLSSIHLPSSLSSASQLLSKSQMLSDSLIRDHAPPTQPPEIWDSEGEDAPL